MLYSLVHWVLQLTMECKLFFQNHCRLYKMECIRNLVLVLSLTMCALAGALANNVSDVHIVCRKITVPLDIDGKFDEPCYAHAEWSAPFSILTKENKDINGLFEQVDDKFIRCAYTYAMFYDDDPYIAINRRTRK